MVASYVSVFLPASCATTGTFTPFLGPYPQAHRASQLRSPEVHINEDPSRVLVGFGGFWWVWVGFGGFYRVLVEDVIGFIGRYWILSGFAL